MDFDEVLRYDQYPPESVPYEIMKKFSFQVKEAISSAFGDLLSESLDLLNNFISAEKKPCIAIFVSSQGITNAISFPTAFSNGIKEFSRDYYFLNLPSQTFKSVTLETPECTFMFIHFPFYKGHPTCKIQDVFTYREGGNK